MLFKRIIGDVTYGQLSLFISLIGMQPLLITELLITQFQFNSIVRKFMRTKNMTLDGKKQHQSTFAPRYHWPLNTSQHWPPQCTTGLDETDILSFVWNTLLNQRPKRHDSNFCKNCVFWQKLRIWAKTADFNRNCGFQQNPHCCLREPSKCLES